jgi:GDP-L-fucose synthase
MAILVAGASGLAGSAIVRELTRIGKPVIGISSKDVDLLDREATFNYIGSLKPKVIIDAAARVGGIASNNTYPVEFLSENIQIQTNLMDAAHSAKVEKFVFLASSCAYPKNCPQPIKEEYVLTGTLESTNSAYAIAKLAGIELIKSYRKQFGHRWISVMPTNLYGPNDNFDLEGGHVFPALIRKFIEAKKSNVSSVNLWGTGKPRREFLHVDDFAKAVIVCLSNYDSDQQINIGTGIDITIAELGEKIAKNIGFSGTLNFDLSKEDGTSQKVLDIQKIINLGWKPTINLDQGISLTVEWYLENKQGEAWHQKKLLSPE